MMQTTPAAPGGGFDQFDLNPAIVRAIADAGFTEPRPIQVSAVPPALAGRDVLGLAQTGTGKTAAFALPILQRLAAGRESRREPRALIVAPTRELAQQIKNELDMLGRHLGVRTVTIYGGVSAHGQIEALRQGADVLVACPGRLLDLHGQGKLSLKRIEMLILDEADHMFDMGFLPALRRIVAAVPNRRQNLLFSATMPKEIRHLADRVLRDPVVIERAVQAPAQTIEHALYPIVEGRKLDLLHRLVSADEFRSAIVFTRTKHRAKQLAKKLGRLGHGAVALQGNMSQNQRDRAMEGFRRQDFQILVATDIAARGIDVARVSHVINFDVPNTLDAYTHRIGRTGRAEQTGRGYMFVTSDDEKMVRAIEHRIGSRIRRLPVGDLSPVVFTEPEPERPGQPSPPRRTRRRSPESTTRTPPRRRRRRSAAGQRGPTSRATR